jgi:hypothetical protein
MKAFHRNISAVCTLFMVGACLAQDRAQFDLLLDVDYQSAAKTVELYEGRFGQPAEIARLRGSQMALMVTAALARRPLDTDSLQASLAAAKFNQNDGAEPFRMREARANVQEIRDLLDALTRRNFGQKVSSTVEQLFPADAQVKARIPVYVVAFGHSNIDAFVTRVRWEGNVPHLVGEDEGEVTVVLNLANAVGYGRVTDERLVGVLSVMAHEIFHAAFELYKETSSRWRQYYAGDRGYVDQLLDLSQNEGVAYYLSLIQRTQGRLPEDGLYRAHTAFGKFNQSVQELISPHIAQRRVREIIQASNMSGYWENFGAITGMIVARQIDQTMGRAALIETLGAGPDRFFQLYAELMRRDPGLPALSPQVLQLVQRSR